jgi:hypothetical protein
MSSKRRSVRLNLSREQQDQVRKAIGRSAEAIELSVEELEERIAPSTLPLGGDQLKSTRFTIE